MTNEQKLQDYEAKFELVKKHLDVNYEYLTALGFEVELEKIVKKIDDLSYKVNVLKDEVNVLKDQVNMLEDEASDLENHVSDLKNEIKDLKKRKKINNI